MLKSLKIFVAEFVGTCILVTSIIGSGIMASNLTSDRALILLINAVSTVLALIVLIELFVNVSGSHFNPIVTANAINQKAITTKYALIFFLAQITGSIFGAILANLMYSRNAIEISTKNRDGFGNFVGEIVATLGLLAIVNFKSNRAMFLVPLWIGSAYFFTSSTSFANPAVTVGRIYSDSFAGIAPKSAIFFIVSQLMAFLLMVMFIRIWRKLYGK